MSQHAVTPSMPWGFQSIDAALRAFTMLYISTLPVGGDLQNLVNLSMWMSRPIPWHLFWCATYSLLPNTHVT